MIKQEIIDKLGLIKTEISVGSSFMYNLEFREWPLCYDYIIYVSDCEIDGEPLMMEDALLIHCQKFGSWIIHSHCSIELLMDDVRRNEFVHNILQSLPSPKLSPS